MADRETHGDIPDDIETSDTRIDRDQHLLIRRDDPPMPDEADLDDGPDVDPDTGEHRPAVYRDKQGNIIRDF